MCGIAGIILKNNQALNIVDKIISLSKAIKHRGPDDDGFLIVGNDKAIPASEHKKSYSKSSEINYLPQNSLDEISDLESIRIAFAHRRLSVIDLNETGHQPMCDLRQKLWISYNGEIYNFIELREELKQFGYTFISESDTEVVLTAYKHWGFDCVTRFNGMWSFCIYDSEKQICFASRDRLGVKPFYFIDNKEFFAFASEQKAFIKSDLIKAKYSTKNIQSYLLDGLIETETTNFFEGITELWPGTNLIYDLKTQQHTIKEYYHLSKQISLNNDALSDSEIISKVESLLENAIRLRLRSDVEVGTCLSGGIDSSVIATLIGKINQNNLFCFTSVFNNHKISEEHFADLVCKQIKSTHVKIEPTLDGFINEVDSLIYSQDAPIWNTSTYAQFKVMGLAKINGIKVVLDGQGADEIFAGYHHHFLAKWNNLISNSNIGLALTDIEKSSKTISNPFLFYGKEFLKKHFDFNSSDKTKILNKDFIKSANTKAEPDFKTVNEVLLNDIYNTRLKTFLKCEDRCGMWHSVESRTPFSDDIDLINFLFSFNGNRKIQGGISKYLLREASKNLLPKEIYSRYDKVGFETPMQNWMIKMRPQLLQEIESSGFDFVNYSTINKTSPDDEYQNKLLFKLFVLGRWQKVFA